MDACRRACLASRLSRCPAGSIIPIMTGQRRRTRAALATIRCAALVLIGMTGMLLIAGCGKRTRTPRVPAPPRLESPTLGGSLSGTKSRIVFPDHGPRIWVAEAEKVIASANPGTLRLERISCQLYQQGREVLRVRADAGQAVQQQAAVRVTLTGNVQAEEGRRGLRLTADGFEWSSQYDRISAVNVRWLGAGFTHRADRAVLTTDLSRATFTGKVKTQSTVSD